MELGKGCVVAAGRSREGSSCDEIRRPRVTGTSAKKDCHIRFSQSGSGVKIKKPCYSAEAARGSEMKAAGFAMNSDARV